MECKPRICQNPECDKPLVKKASESRARFAARKTCNYICSARKREIERRQFGKKFCKDCGKEFTKSAFVSASRWEKKRRCSVCATLRYEKYDKNRPSIWKDTDGKPIKPGFYIF